MSVIKLISKNYYSWNARIPKSWKQAKRWHKYFYKTRINEPMEMKAKKSFLNQLGLVSCLYYFSLLIVRPKALIHFSMDCIKFALLVICDSASHSVEKICTL